jgi:hypothetical protein
MLNREMVNITTQATTAQRKLNRLTQAGEEGRTQYNIAISLTELEKQAENLQNQLTLHTNDNLSILASMITIHGLKVASRGRLLRDKQGKPQYDENGNAKYTPANTTALRILQNGINETSGILDDMQQDTALAIWEAVSQGKATITTEEGKPKLTTTEANSDTMKNIYNVVKNYMYAHQQRHYKRQYIPVINEETGEESAEMVTKAMRNYEMSIDAIGQDELFQSLTAILDERETAILWAKTEKKQVERSYTSNNIQKRHFVSRYKTVAEISQETDYTVKQVRNSLKTIQEKLTAVLAENERVTRIKPTHTTTNRLAWVNHMPTTETLTDVDEYTRQLNEHCNQCKEHCTKSHSSGLQCARVEMWLV